MITEPFVLAADVTLTPVHELPPSLRARLDAGEGDYALARPTTRDPVRLLDAQAADLLQRFRSPMRIIDAVLAYSRDRRAAAEVTLEEAFPMFERLIESRVLVAEKAREAGLVGPSLQVGDHFAGTRVLATLRALDDTELHLVRTADAGEAALKLFKAGGRPGLLAQMQREEAILRRLGGTNAPRLLGTGTGGERPYLLLEWCSGISATAAAGEVRRLAGEDHRGALLELCCAIAGSYARMHAAGVAHGDVHPDNLVVAADGSVTIVDFGFAVTPGSEDAPGARAPRGGVAFFFEPEYALARRSGQPPPPASLLGEQYAVAAVLYLLVTGSHYLDFSLEPEEMLRQVAEDAPLPFTARNVPAWPELEELLGTCLAKRPQARLPEIATLAARLEALKATVPASPSGPRIDLAPARSLLETMLERVGFDGPLLSQDPSVAPTSSLNYGAAGIAYALYRLACTRDDAALLALADVWGTRAHAHMDDETGCYSVELDVTPDTVGRSSAFHTAAGVEAVATLIAHARGDGAARSAALAGFLDRSRLPTRGLDLTLGRSSTLLGCCLLFEALVTADPTERDALRRYGDSTFAHIWTEIAGLPPIPDGDEITYTGVAHGWAGLLYAALLWSEVTRTAPPPEVAGRLEELARCGEPSGRGLRWAVRTRVVNHSMPGWCNGSAGFVHLFTLAQQVTGDERWTRLAERAGWSTWEADQPVSSLCCGRGGRAYALLNLYRHTGDTAWLTRARDLAVRAAAETVDGESQGRGDSLYKGRLGVALLAADIEVPDQARMPFFEPEGWPEV